MKNYKNNGVLNITKEKRDLEKKFKDYLNLKDKHTKIVRKLVMYTSKQEYADVAFYIYDVADKIEYLFVNLIKFLEGDTDFTEQKGQKLYNNYKEVNNEKDYSNAKTELNNQIEALFVKTTEMEKRLQDILKYIKERDEKQALLEKEQAEYQSSEEYKQKEAKIEAEEKINREKAAKRIKEREDNATVEKEKKDLEKNFSYYHQLNKKIDTIMSNLFIRLDQRTNYNKDVRFAYKRRIDKMFVTLFEYLLDKDFKNYSNMKVNLYKDLHDFAAFIDKEDKRLQETLKSVEERKAKEALKQKQHKKFQK